MEREELLKALRRTVVQTGSLCCLGCGYEHNCSIHGCAIIKDAALQIQLMDEEIFRLMDRIHELERAAMTPQSAVNILRNANLGGILRTAADMGIEALEREMGGKHETG